MNLTQKSVSFGASLLAGSLVALSVSPAQAATLTASDVVGAGCVGQASCSVNGFGLSVQQPSGYLMTQKTVGGVLGIGVSRDGSSGPKSSDPSQGEIDFGEILGINFAPSVVKSLDLSFLYRPGVYNDKVFEIAQVFVGDLIGSLTVTGSNTATWSLGGVVQNLSPSNNKAGGSYRIVNPFGDMVVSGFSLTPQRNQDKNGNTPLDFTNSDFTFSGVETAPVPEPATTAALLGIAAASGLGLRRRKQTA